jgi:hypothetical protein
MRKPPHAPLRATPGFISKSKPGSLESSLHGKK